MRIELELQSHAPKGTRSQKDRPLPSGHYTTPAAKRSQARLGQKTAQETLDTYGHLWIDDEELTREAIGTELGQALTVCRVQAGPEGSVSSE